MSLRIYADFNSGGLNGEPCWLLRYGPEMRPLGECADMLGLMDGMEVVLFHEDLCEEFEVSAKLIAPRGPGHSWKALPEWDTLRHIRG